MSMLGGRRDSVGFGMRRPMVRLEIGQVVATVSKSWNLGAPLRAEPVSALE